MLKIKITLNTTLKKKRKESKFVMYIYTSFVWFYTMETIFKSLIQGDLRNFKDHFYLRLKKHNFP